MHVQFKEGFTNIYGLVNLVFSSLTYICFKSLRLSVSTEIKMFNYIKIYMPLSKLDTCKSGFTKIRINFYNFFKRLHHCIIKELL